MRVSFLNFQFLGVDIHLAVFQIALVSKNVMALHLLNMFIEIFDDSDLKLTSDELQLKIQAFRTDFHEDLWLLHLVQRTCKLLKLTLLQIFGFDFKFPE